MNGLLMLAVFVALLGFVLLLKPELIWNKIQKEKDGQLSAGFAALLRLGGIGVLVLSVVIADMV